ncbi:CPBP family intramembrane metalloprotease [Massilia agilis]|uniref:CPBP family intramembrane metalloprotease n=1 Tax=Massilia agilis TaxID=1811226 RepID=A0ABT2DHA3_9BURK|nr:CPBP family intramembrane glutamic endopeptidase [Massilia agilis]MCS0810652.1 CPBP family intramembrane metalloprotease [Massilia agilis]
MALRMAVEIFMALTALALGIAAIVRARRAGEPVLDLLGLRWGPTAGRDLLAGMAITGLAMGGVFVAELGLGAITTAPATAGSSLLVLAPVKLAFTLKEEIMMRSLLLTGLLMVLRGRAALAVGLSALAFGCIHLTNPGASLLSVLGNTLGGVIYGGAFVLARNLWLPIGLHFAWNFVQGPLLGFPVSGMDAGGLQQVHDLGPAWLTGGSYGPEAGLVGIVARFVVMALLLLWVGARARGASPALQAAAS